MVSRRGFLGLSGAILAGGLSRRVEAQSGTQGAGADLLRDPTSIGRPRAPRNPLDNDPTIIALEKRLRCTCGGCTLDIYTCRTTDFTCTFSPALHQEIIAMYTAGQDSEAIVATLVEREGPQMLMAPPATGVNLIAGYLLPGMVVATAGLLLIAWLLRRRETGHQIPLDGSPASVPVVTTADAERLKRALDEVEG